jgi:hypothetical protein
MDVSSQLHVPAALPSEKEPPGTNWTGGWVDTRVGVEAVVKRKILSPCQDSNPRSSSP